MPVEAQCRMTSVVDSPTLQTFTVLQFLIVSPLIALAWRTETKPVPPFRDAAEGR